MSEPGPRSEDSETDNAATEKARRPDPQKQPEKRASRESHVHISVAQLLMGVLVAIFLWQWFDGHRAIGDMQQQLAKKIAELDGDSQANRVLSMQVQDQVRALSAKVATMESNYIDPQKQRAALEALYNDISAHRDESTLAEVEQLLLIAQQQLRISANVRAALIAMQSADARLQHADRPVFDELRQAISRDMDKLRVLHDADIAGINMQLNNLIATVDQMPLAYQQRAANEPAATPVTPDHATAWQGFLHELWQEIRALVRIDNTGKAEVPLLPPNQEFFLRENLKLALLSARIALLSRDGESYRLGLDNARDWTARYFDGKSGESKHMLDALHKLAASDISVQLPDISGSLQAVRNYRLSHESLAGAEPGTAKQKNPPARHLKAAR